MKKAVVLCLALIVSLFAVTGSIAYFTDNIQVQNRAASGNLHILQHEYERVKGDNGTFVMESNENKLRDYTQNQAFYPAVQATGLDTGLKIGEATYTINSKSMNGFVDKIVVVENGGTLDAYVRTFVAVPSSFAKAIHLDWNVDKNGGWSEPIQFPTGDNQNIIINDVEYTVWYSTYGTKLDPKTEAAPSLLGFYLDSQVNHNGENYILKTDSETVILGTQSELKILVATQAAQANPQVFNNAVDAMEATYPEIELDDKSVLVNHPWVNNDLLHLFTGGGDLTDSLKDLHYNTQIGLANGEYTLPETLPAGIRIFAMGDEVKITNTTINAIDVEFDSVIFTKDVAFTGWGAFEDCSFEGSFTSTTSATGEVLFSECTFKGTEPSGERIVFLPNNP